MADSSIMPQGLGIVGATGAWGAFVTLLAIFVRQWVPLRRIRVDAEQKFRDDLAERVTSLESKLEKKDADHMAEMAIMRHRLNNVTACLDALLLLIEQDPAKASEAAEKIRRMRAGQLTAEATERGAVSAAKIERSAE